MILHRIYSQLLPTAINITSIAQLGDVANILGGKLQTLGFGNYLAQQVMKVHSVYEQLGFSLPTALLTAESIVLHEGSSARKPIIIELSEAKNSPLHVRVETEFKIEPVLKLPIAA